LAGSVNEKMNGNIDEGVNNGNSDLMNVGVDELFADQAVVDSDSFLPHFDNNLGYARNMVPLLGRGETLGFAGLREQVILQTNTQKREGLNYSEINKQPISLVEPKDRIDLVCIVQDAADVNRPRYLTGEEQRDYPRRNGYGKRHTKYWYNQVRVSPTNFLSSERDRPKTQNYCSRNNGFAQNNRRYLARASWTNFSRTQNSYSCYMSG